MGIFQDRICSKNPRHCEEAFEMARKNQGGNTEWGGNEKVLQYLEDTIARLELSTRNTRESIGEDDLLTAFAGKKSP